MLYHKNRVLSQAYLKLGEEPEKFTMIQAKNAFSIIWYLIMLYIEETLVFVPVFSKNHASNIELRVQ